MHYSWSWVVITVWILCVHVLLVTVSVLTVWILCVHVLLVILCIVWVYCDRNDMFSSVIVIIGQSAAAVLRITSARFHWLFKKLCKFFLHPGRNEVLIYSRKLRLFCIMFWEKLCVNYVNENKLYNSKNLFIMSCLQSFYYNNLYGLLVRFTNVILS